MKLKFGLLAASGGIATTLASAVLFNGVAHGEWSLPGLQQQVQHVTEVTQNHEGRITNLEGKVNTPSGQPTPTPEVITKVVTVAAPQSSPTSSIAPSSQTSTTPEAKATPSPPVLSYWYYENTCSGEKIYYGAYSDWHTNKTSYRTDDETDAKYNGNYATGGCSANSL